MDLGIILDGILDFTKLVLIFSVVAFIAYKIFSPLREKIAEKFYLEARELQITGQGGYKEWAYRKGAWALDDLSEDIQRIYKNEGLFGIMQIKGIGKSLADKIEKLLKVENSK